MSKRVPTRRTSRTRIPTPSSRLRKLSANGLLGIGLRRVGLREVITTDIPSSSYLGRPAPKLLLLEISEPELCWKFRNLPRPMDVAHNRIGRGFMFVIRNCE